MSTFGAEKLFALQGREQREAKDLGVSLAQLSSPALGSESTSYIKFQPPAGLELTLKCNHLCTVPFQEAAASFPSSTSLPAEVKPVWSWRGLTQGFREGRGPQVSAGSSAMGGNGLWRWAGASAPHSLFVSSFNPSVASLLPILVILGTTIRATERCPHVSLEHLELSLFSEFVVLLS